MILLSHEDVSEARVDDIARKIVGVANANLRPPDSHITFEVDPCAVVIPSRAVAILALVLNEMVSNAIKHGMTGMREGIVTISGREEDGMVIVEVLDTGNGPPVSESLEEDDSEGLGLSLIRNLMGDIGGEFTLRRTYGNTSSHLCRSTFPIGKKDSTFLKILRSLRLCFQCVAAFYAETISNLVFIVAVGTGIEQRATTRTEIYIRLIGAFTIGA